MNSLSLGFLYVVGFGWGLCEVCLIAGTGNWWPLALYFGYFWVAFSVFGCLDLSDRANNAFGALTAVLLAFSLLVFGIQGFDISFGVGLLKLLSAIAFAATAIVTLIPSKNTSDSHGH